MTEPQERSVIDWMSGLPAPAAEIELMSCMCKKVCNDDARDCHLTTCSNLPDEEKDTRGDLDKEDVDFD